jgi:uncharacterized protein (TIGR02453 family)
MLTKNVIPFLTELSKNNNKNWFTKNKDWYQTALNDFKNFIDKLIPQLALIDPTLSGLTAKDCVYRIYRDVRFSKDKTPYKNHFGANIGAGGRKNKKAGFYVHIEPTGTSITGGGIFMPKTPVLKALRNEFYQVPEELIEIIEASDYKKYFAGLWDDDKLKTAPKGFPKDFEHIELLKYKSYIAVGKLTLTDISQPNLISHLIDIYQAMYPLNRLINTIIEDAELG